MPVTTLFGVAVNGKFVQLFENEEPEVLQDHVSLGDLRGALEGLDLLRDLVEGLEASVLHGIQLMRVLGVCDCCVIVV
jgi:hypothetical protein